jgi:hypothetical protein
MTRQRRIALAALCAIGLAAVVLPSQVGAQKVANPGVFSLSAAAGGAARIGALTLDLTPQPLPQCSDGIDNETVPDNRIDAPLDFQCAAGPNGEPASSDDSELAPGFQPKQDVQITGTIDKNGVVTIPTTGFQFPPAYVAINFNGVWIVKAEVLATAPATGTLDPLTGAVALDVRARIKLSGNVGNQLASTCSIGTVASPVTLNLITGRKEAIGTNGAITGSPYNTATGRALLVDNAFAVPGSSGCTAGIFNLNSTINGQVGIPSAAGNNLMVLPGVTNPILTKGITPVISTNPPTISGAAPQTIDFAATASQVSAGPATYSWAFSDGTSASGANVSKTFSSGGTYTATLTVTDADGDTASVGRTFTLTGSTTTTTASTTSTTEPTTTTTASTTTTTEPTTTTTASTTTTTEPTTTTTASTTTTSTTTTTQPTTTTTASTTTTTQPTTTTTASTTTTTEPTTTTTASTTTTTLVPSDDSASVAITGLGNYQNEGSGSGDITVTRDSLGIQRVQGVLDLEGTNGGTARFSVTAQRAWILPLWTGQVSLRDSGAGMNVTAPIFGQISSDGSPNSARGSASWFQLGQFPNLLRPFTLNWSVIDAD